MSAPVQDSSAAAGKALLGGGGEAGGSAAGAGSLPVQSLVQEMGVSLVLAFHWLECGHMTTPNCRGDWEMWSWLVPRQKQRTWILVKG